MPEQLRSNGNPVRVGSVVLQTPGLEGVATSHAATAAGLRGIEGSTESLALALANEGFRTQETVEIARAREVPAGAARVRSTSFSEPAIVLEAPDPGDQWGQVVLSTDESGVVTWNFARDEGGALDVTRGRGTRTYVIRRRVGAPAAPGQTRGLIGALGKKVLKVLVFPLIDPVAGEVGDYLAARWEKAKRPYRLRSFTPTDYASAATTALEESNLATFSSGRSLLMVHGTMGRAHIGFGLLPVSFVETLAQRYGGRVLAFDHFTLSEDPLQNVQWLIDHLPPQADLDLDIICHSRGGLVSRVLAEMQAKLSLGARKVRVNRVVFVATPNAGTILADAERLGSLVDSFTNVLNFFPDNGVTEVLEAVLTVVKQLAVGAFKGMEGLYSMAPTGSFLKELNQGGPFGSRYFALASNYEPADQGLKYFARDILFDNIFGVDNDLIVPTGSVWDKNGSAQFPITEKHVFSAASGVHHSGFFADAEARGKILGWLTA